MSDSESDPRATYIVPTILVSGFQSAAKHTENIDFNKEFQRISKNPTAHAELGRLAHLLQESRIKLQDALIYIRSNQRKYISAKGPEEGTVWAQIHEYFSLLDGLRYNNEAAVTGPVDVSASAYAPPPSELPAVEKPVEEEPQDHEDTPKEANDNEEEKVVAATKASKPDSDDLKTVLNNSGIPSSLATFIGFTWFDSVEKREHFVASVYLEKASWLMAIGLAVSDQVLEDVKEAKYRLAGNLQAASAITKKLFATSGLFLAAEQEVINAPVHVPATADLQGGVVAKKMSMFCLALAAECIASVAIGQKQDPLLIASLLVDVLDRYKPLTAYALTEVKTQYYAGLAHYYVACKRLEPDDQEGCVAAIAALQVAEKCMLQSVRTGRFEEPREAELAEIRRALTAANHDNDKVYRFTVPPVEALPVAKSLVKGKTIPFYPEPLALHSVWSDRRLANNLEGQIDLSKARIKHGVTKEIQDAIKKDEEMCVML